MEDQEILSQIEAILNKVLKKQNVQLSAETAAGDVDGWDSLTHMIIIDSIEKHFSIRFKLMEIMKFNNIGDMISCIKKKKAA